MQTTHHVVRPDKRVRLFEDYDKMSSPRPSRASINEYFHYQTMIDRPWWGWILSVLQAILVFGTVPLWVFLRPGEPPEEMSLRVLEAIAVGGIVFGLTSIVKFTLFQFHKTLARTARKARLTALEADVRDIVRADYKRALRQLVQKAGIQPNDLRAIGSAHHDCLEDRLFDSRELRRFLGLMKDQTIRMATPYGPEPDFAAITDKRLTGTGLFSGYFMPVRLVCLFFTRDELILGDSIFDSRTGDLQCRITKLPSSAFTGMKTETQTTRQSLNRNRLICWLSNHQFPPSVERAITRTIRQFDQQTATPKPGVKVQSPWMLARRVQTMSLNTGTSQTLTLPMRMDHALVRSDQAQDSDFRNMPFPLAAQDKAARESAPHMIGGRTESPVKGNKYLEYRTRFTLITELIVACVIVAGCLALFNSLNKAGGGGESRFTASAQHGEAMVMRNGTVVPKTEDWRRLPATLASRVRADESWAFACTKTAISLYASPRRDSRTLARMEAFYPVAVLRPQAGSESEKLPPGWVEAEIVMNDTFARGYMTDSSLADRSASGPLICKP